MTTTPDPLSGFVITMSSRFYIERKLRPRAVFRGLGGGAGKGPGIGRPIRHFDWSIDLGNPRKKMAK